MVTPTNKARSASKPHVKSGEEGTEKQLLARKLYLMRKMLKNERRANEIISNKLSMLTTSVHANNKTIGMMSQSLKQSKTGVVALN